MSGGWVVTVTEPCESCRGKGTKFTRGPILGMAPAGGGDTLACPECQDEAPQRIKPKGSGTIEVSRQEVDTPRELRKAIIEALVAKGIPRSKVWDFDVIGNSAVLSDGSTITVERKEGEGR